MVRWCAVHLHQVSVWGAKVDVAAETKGEAVREFGTVDHDAARGIVLLAHVLFAFETVLVGKDVEQFRCILFRVRQDRPQRSQNDWRPREGRAALPQLETLDVVVDGHASIRRAGARLSVDNVQIFLHDGFENLLLHEQATISRVRVTTSSVPINV